LPDHSPPFSLYIHYPFCIKRCPYCGFATAVGKEDLAARYREALLLELERRLAEEPWRSGEIATVYFGGGTPSLAPPSFIATILQTLNSRLQTPDCEITLEANPETRDAGAFAAFRKAGVNRLSMGAQSFDPDELKLLERAHSVGGVRDAVRIAREAGFDNLSLDLIYGLPGQTIDSFRRSVGECLDLGVDHLSAYTLSIEEGTPFARSVREKRLPTPDPDLMADQYAVLIEAARLARFEHYELTNYCRPGFQSRHNSAYWDRTPYLGIGSGAHSFDGVRRYWNRRDTRAHIKAIEAGGEFFEGSETISPEQALAEDIYLSLRTRRGLTQELIAELGSAENLEALKSGGYLKLRDGVWIIPEERWLMLDEVVLRLMEK